MRKNFFVLLAFFMLLSSASGALAVTVEELNSRVSDPAFSNLPKDAVFGIVVYGVDWSDNLKTFILSNGVFNDAAYYTTSELNSIDIDFVVGVKEEFLEQILQVQDLCRFAKSLPRNPDQYRVLAYDWWSFLWNYKCFSAKGCLEKYCGG